MRPLAFLSSIYRWLFPDKRSEWEKKRERSIIDAVNQLKNYSVTDQGGLSMDPEEARDAILRFAEENKKAEQVDHHVKLVPAGILMERYAWRRQDSVLAVRYAFFKSADGLCAVLDAERYSSTITCQDGLKGNHFAVANAVKAITRNELVWHTSLESAIQAYEEKSKGAL